ncbi:MAG: competence/damage-inducible protein A [Actinomycetota bacterium]|nr:competence/damage-inducible protein A [Actinomycetota bacterium]
MGKVEVSVVTTGDELLSGEVSDTNLSMIASEVRKIGFEVKMHVTVCDDEEKISEEIRRLADKYDVVIITGGLGPTPDDLTREAIARATGKKLELREELADAIEKLFLSRGRRMPSENLKQAYLPGGALAIPPAGGTAPGFMLEYQNSLIVSLPGVPSEMRSMLLSHVIPELQNRFKSANFSLTRKIMTFGAGESEVAEKLEKTMRNSSVSYGFLVNAGLIVVKLTTSAPTKKSAHSLLNSEEKKVRKVLGKIVFGTDDVKMEEVVGELLRKQGLTISVAESCTAGMVASRITNVPGSSDYFLGGVVTYSAKSKHEILGIPEEFLSKGLVTREVAEAMARSVKDLFGSDIGLGITGIAGPGRGEERKKVGTVCIGLATSEDINSWERVFPGEREMVRNIASSAALNAVRLWGQVLQ